MASNAIARNGFPQVTYQGHTSEQRCVRLLPTAKAFYMRSKVGMIHLHQGGLDIPGSGRLGSTCDDAQWRD